MIGKNWTGWQEISLGMRASEKDIRETETAYKDKIIDILGIESKRYYSDQSG